MLAGEPVLDLGCGRKTVLGPVARTAVTVGVDPDLETLARNDVLSHRVLGSGDRLPFKDATFSLVLSTFVVEHLDRPSLVVSEVRRVLRPGGTFVFLTPNAWNYTSWIIRAVPQRWHPKLARSMWGRDRADTFPTRYRMNTPSRVRAIMREAGLREERLILNGDPTYVVFNDASFKLACLVERALELPRLAWARVHILGVFRKPG